MPDPVSRVLVVLNRPSLSAPGHEPGAAAFRLVDPDTPVVSALDSSATRGDGIFETIGVGDGHPQALEHHLRRFEQSAARLQLPAPDLDVYRAAVAAAIAALPVAAEASAKTVLTRGVEGSGRPTGWVSATVSPDFRTARTEGIRVVLLDRGVRHDIEQTAPWLLSGAKTLSYAMNLAAIREAQSRGADDAVYVSSDGYLLEGPTSSLVYRVDGALWTPGTGIGVLDGTTQANVFRFAESQGLRVGFRLAEPEELRRADGIWLVSSVRRAAPVRELDGLPVPVDHAFTAALNAFLAAIRD